MPLVYVEVAKGKIVKAEQRGTVVVTSTFNGVPCRVTLNDVLYIPGVSHNLISLSQLGQQGYKGTWDDRELLAYSGGTLAVGGKQEQGLYIVEEVHLAVDALVADYIGEQSSINLWHKRLAHASEKYLKKVIKLPKGVQTRQV